MAHATLIIRTVFGIIGNFFSVGLFAYPMPIFYRVIKNKSVEELRPEHYLIMTMNCMFWVLYGMPVMNPGNILVLTANGIGLVMQLAYLIIFILYAKDNQDRMCMGVVVLFELAVIGLEIGLAIGLQDTRAIVATFAFSFSPVIYVHRFVVLLGLSIEEEKSPEDMPFLVVLSHTFNDLCWLIYASLSFEPAIWFTYCVGFIVGVAQLVVHGVHCKSTCGDDKKLATAEVQLREIDIVDDKKLATAETLCRNYQKLSLQESPGMVSAGRKWEKKRLRRKGFPMLELPRYKEGDIAEWSDSFCPACGRDCKQPSGDHAS